MTRQHYILFAALGSFALLAGAFLFQALGWAPCRMCLWQRWPHAAAIALGGLAILLGPSRALAGLGAVATLSAAGLAGYHTGVERDWWEGPAACSGSGAGLGGLSGADLLPSAAQGPAVVLCDTLTPFFFGLTMANWNLILSAGLALVWLAATRKAVP